MRSRRVGATYRGSGAVMTTSSRGAFGSSSFATERDTPATPRADDRRHEGARPGDSTASTAPAHIDMTMAAKRPGESSTHTAHSNPSRKHVTATTSRLWRGNRAARPERARLVPEGNIRPSSRRLPDTWTWSLRPGLASGWVGCYRRRLSLGQARIARCAGIGSHMNLKPLWNRFHRWWC